MQGFREGAGRDLSGEEVEKPTEVTDFTPTTDVAGETIWLPALPLRVVTGALGDGFNALWDVLVEETAD